MTIRPPVHPTFKADGWGTAVQPTRLWCLFVSLCLCTIFLLGISERKVYAGMDSRQIDEGVRVIDAGIFGEDVPPHIPRLIHQSWKNELVRVHAYGRDSAKWIKSWVGGCHQNSSWMHVFWSDQDNRHLFEKHLPQYIATYDNLPQGIFRADMSRYAILYVAGGVYADMDFDCVKDFDDLLQREDILKTGAFLSSEPWPQTLILYNIPEVACNAIMGGVAGHPLWLAMLDRIKRMVEASECREVMKCTGPMGLDEEYRNPAMVNNVTMLSSDYFYPEIAVNNINSMKGNCAKIQYPNRIAEKVISNLTRFKEACDIISNYKEGQSLWTENTIARHSWQCSWCGPQVGVVYANISTVVPAGRLLRPASLLNWGRDPIQ